MRGQPGSGGRRRGDPSGPAGRRPVTEPVHLHERVHARDGRDVLHLRIPRRIVGRDAGRPELVGGGRRRAGSATTERAGEPRTGGEPVRGDAVHGPGTRPALARGSEASAGFGGLLAGRRPPTERPRAAEGAGQAGRQVVGPGGRVSVPGDRDQASGKSVRRDSVGARPKPRGEPEGEQEVGVWNHGVCATRRQIACSLRQWDDPTPSFGSAGSLARLSGTGTPASARGRASTVLRAGRCLR